MEKETEVDAQYIKNFCKERGITQKELADMVGMTPESISNILSSGKLSNQLKNSIKLLVENENLKQELANYNGLKAILKEIASEIIKK